MREGTLAVVCVLCGSTALGCYDRDFDDPGEIARSGTARTVLARCDEAGNLHLRAPADARVGVPSPAGDDAEAEVVLDDDASANVQMPRPRRPRSRSLGFIGDGKLTPSPDHGSRWSHGVHDDLLPPHAHGQREPFVVAAPGLAWPLPRGFRPYYRR